MFTYKEAPNFKYIPLEEEISLIADILQNKLKGEKYASIPCITEELKKLYPNVKKDILSRIVYLSLHIIDDRQMKTKGWRKISLEELNCLAEEKKKIIYHSQGFFGNREIKLTPKKVGERIYWMLPKCRRKYMPEFEILNSYIKEA